jgi:hypothetical protein
MEISRIIPVDYDDAEHRYSLSGQRYLSATQVIEKFKNPFNPKEASEKFAAKNGATPEYWRQQWEAQKEAACDRGNMIHEANEIALHGRMIDTWDGKVHPVLGDMIAESDPWIERPDGVYIERKLWHHGYQVAGRADKIILLTDRETGIRYAHIDDYKTNKELKKTSYQFKGSGNYKMMKPPLGHVMDCNWFHYQLQLSLYMFMLEYQGFAPGKMKLTYYPHPSEENPSPRPEPHPVTYMKREVVNMLNFLRRA